MADPERVRTDALAAPVAANDETAVASGPDIPDRNVVSTAVRTITELMDEMEELRAGLVAGGIPFQTSAVLTEMSVHGKLEARELLIESSVGAAFEAYGQDGVDRMRLIASLERMTELERDIAHERRLLRGQEIDVHSVNLLVQLIRHNPGDGGAHAAREFASYAIACGLPIGDALARAKTLTVDDASVLPRIARPERSGGAASASRLLVDVAWGALVGTVLLLLLV